MKRARLRSIAVVAILILLAGAAASAQDPTRRHGFRVGAGAGYGIAKASCDSCASEPRSGGVTSFVTAGITLGSSVWLGGTLDGWTRRSHGATETMANLAASVSYYPLASPGFFVTGGLGVSRYRANTSPGATGSGWGLLLGVGYDLDVSRRVSLSPVARYVYGNVGNINIGGGGGTFATGWKQNVLSFDLGLTFHK